MFWFIVLGVVVVLGGAGTWRARGRQRKGVDLGRVLRSRGIDEGRGSDFLGGGGGGI